ncbi:MAG: tRNA pseudouridine synthase TruD [Planctomycetaceae bacterium]|nr:tRNA pseudouridine synthase TruD [Planctomycetaceae bacterium]
MGTPETIEEILRRWKLPRDRVSYGGLKDKHALTTQFVTIFQGPRRDLREHAFEMIYVGQASQPFTPQFISGNKFLVTLRSLQPDAVKQVIDALEFVRRDGIPNYFDDQRFGSVGFSGEFVAQPWCLGNYERTIWLALADANEHDRPDERAEKQALRDHWGNWQACKRALRPSNRRSIITFLADRPDDFRGAVGRLRIDLRGIYLAAFQSAMWNRLLAAWIKAECRPDQLVPVSLKLGPVPFFEALDDAQRTHLQGTTLPLPSARIKLEPGPVATIMDDILKDVGLELRQVRVKYPRDSFFSKGDRKAVIPLNKIESLVAADDIDVGRQKIRLNFELPRGSYATILVKRLTELNSLVPKLEDAEPEDDSSEHEFLDL